MTLVSRAAVFAFATLIPGAALACPDYGLTGTALNYTADAVWTPQSHQLLAGGEVDLSSCEGDAAGFVAAAPDFDLTYTNDGRALEFRVEGSCDTLLLINTASGEWLYNDDDADINPRIRLDAADSGEYDIWVGTYDANLCDATLIIESF